MDWSHYLNIATYVIAAASAVANLTPTNTDNVIVDALSKLVHAFALNWTSSTK